MTFIAMEQRGVNARFDTDTLHIEFSDPSYACAETVLFDPDNRAVHAVLHEGLFLIGYAPAGFNDYFQTHQDIELRANHYAGKPISLRAQISILKH